MSRFRNLGVYAGVAAAIVLLFFVPTISGGSTFILFTATSIFFYINLCQTFRFINLTSDWSFAHVTVMGMGAYASALLAIKAGWPFLACFFTASLVSVAICLPIYALSFKTKGETFFWLTWAIGEVIRQVWIRFKNPFGGDAGLGNIPKIVISLPGLRVEFLSQVPYYYMGLVLTVVTNAFLYAVEKSRIGLNFKVIASNSDLASSLGINVFRHRMLAVVIASFFVGFNGSFYAHWIGFLSPRDYGLSFLLLTLLYVIVGGRQTIWGAVMGVTAFYLLNLQLKPFQQYILAVYGGVLILVLAFFSDGLEGLVKLVASLFKRVFGRKRVATEGLPLNRR